MLILYRLEAGIGSSHRWRSPHVSPAWLSAASGWTRAAAPRSPFLLLVAGASSSVCSRRTRVGQAPGFTEAKPGPHHLHPARPPGPQAPQAPGSQPSRPPSPPGLPRPQAPAPSPAGAQAGCWGEHTDRGSRRGHCAPTGGAAHGPPAAVWPPSRRPLDGTPRPGRTFTRKPLTPLCDNDGHAKCLPRVSAHHGRWDIPEVSNPRASTMPPWGREEISRVPACVASVSCGSAHAAGHVQPSGRHVGRGVAEAAACRPGLASQRSLPVVTGPRSQPPSVRPSVQVARSSRVRRGESGARRAGPHPHPHPHPHAFSCSALPPLDCVVTCCRLSFITALYWRHGWEETVSRRFGTRPDARHPRGPGVEPPLPAPPQMRGHLARRGSRLGGRCRG